jgi:hypothetical protein
MVWDSRKYSSKVFLHIGAACAAQPLMGISADAGKHQIEIRLDLGLHLV